MCSASSCNRSSIPFLLLLSLCFCQYLVSGFVFRQSLRREQVCRQQPPGNPDSIFNRHVKSDSSTANGGTRTSLHASSTEKFDETCDVLVLGSGPAARSVASLLAVKNNVIVADQNFDRRFAPNYGVWKDEWEAVLQKYASMGVDLQGGKCGGAIDREWNVTDCFFGGSFDIPVEERLRLDRPYLRIDRDALRDTLTPKNYRVVRANHVSRALSPNVYSPAGTLVHDEDGTTIVLQTAAKENMKVRARLVVDCTGHETELVLKETREVYRPPGFQIAYGCLVEVAGALDSKQIGPYDKEAMTLFDYRTDHFLPENEIKGMDAPTFMYAMPLEGNKIFFEETSLVARPALSFQECKDRCFRRLEHLGVQVTRIEEEEFCYIPMGGALPKKDQRIIPVGGAAAMVHPSTGYHLCRCMMGASDIAKIVIDRLSRSDPNLDEAAAAAYHAIWSPGNIRQRNFAVFGGEFLMKQNVVGLRGFFDGFFRLPLEQWGGFLAGWPGLPNNEQHETWAARLWYGLSFVIRLPPPVALDMLASIILYSVEEGIPLLQSVTPFFGEPSSYEYNFNNDKVGDVAAKTEARKMIRESEVEEDVPVALQR